MTDEQPVSIDKPRRKNLSNPDDMLICENGHLQYNVTEEDAADLIRRGMEVPPGTWEGAKCRHCDEQVSLLTTDPAHLQQKLSTQMMIVTALREQMSGFIDANNDQNALALFIRQNYGYEIELGQPQHSGTLSKAAIYYLQRERRRVSVRAARFGRWLLRMVGAA